MVRDAGLRPAPHHEVCGLPSNTHEPHPEEAAKRPSRRMATGGDLSAAACDDETVMNGVYLYIVRCADGSYYTGTARDGLERRIDEHNAGLYDGYTAKRRPITLVFSQWFERITDAIAAERQIKG